MKTRNKYFMLLSIVFLFFFPCISVFADTTITSPDLLKKSSIADVRAFGAKDDGISDSTANIQAALDSPAGTIMIVGNIYKITGQLNVPRGKRVISDGKTVIKAGSHIAWPKVMIRLNGNNLIEGLTLDANCSFSKGVIRPDGAEFGIMALNSSHNIIRNCRVFHFKTVGIGIYAVDASVGHEAHYNTIEGCKIESYDFVNAGAGVGGIGIIVRSDYPGADAEDLGDFLHYNYTYTFKVTDNKIINNTILNGLLAIALNNTAKNIVSGNTIIGATGTGIEIEPKALNNTVSGNSIHDCGGGNLSIAFGSHNNVVDRNSLTGVHGVYNYAVGVFCYANDNIVSNNMLDSRFDKYTGPESRSPGNGILIAQYCKNVNILGNNIKGYRYGIHAQTTMYHGVVTPSDPEYYLTGFQNLSIKDNIIQKAYTVEVNAPPRLAMQQNSLYGIWIDKNTAYDDASLGALQYTGIVVDNNTVDGAAYPYVVSEATAMAVNPARFEDVVFQNNKAINCTSPAGIPNYPTYVNVQLDKYKGLNNSWNFRKIADGVPPFLSLVLWGYGDIVKVTDRDITPGSVYEYQFVANNTFYPRIMPGTIATGSEGDFTLTWTSTAPTFLFASALSQDRTLTLSTINAVKGAKFKIVRTATSTGAFNLNVGSPPLKVLTSPGQWCEVEFDGSAWQLTGYGTL